MAKRIVIMWHCRLRHHSSQALILKLYRLERLMVRFP
jgi:hypothetical protein